MINSKTAQELLEKSGYEVSDIVFIPEGSNHKVFIVTLKDLSKFICKFPVQRHTENNMITTNLDTLFGGELSLDRESALYTIAREKGNVPAPVVYNLCHIDDTEFIALELMSGLSFKSYIEDSNYSKELFLKSIEMLGTDFANIQKIHFNSYGNIISEEIIYPKNITNFSDRFSEIVKNRIIKANDKGAFTKAELVLIQDFFNSKLDYFRPNLDINTKPPVMVFTDMHADNYFVDDSGKPSGYFDLESSQAAPAELEFYGLRFFLFNYFNEETMSEAEEIFFKGYNEAGGLYAPKNNLDHQLIDFLSACRLLELTESYWGYIDGLRDLWAFKMKTILMNYIFSNKIDYIILSDIFREKTKQPKSPN